jgi:hypothetical protein
MNQSAERLGVQKNVLRIGFDSSTEKIAIFIGLKQKKQVAPLPVKNGKSVALSRKRAEMVASFLPIELTCCGLNCDSCAAEFALITA